MEQEQVNQIKEQIIKQIDSWNSSPEQKEQAKNQILEMPEKQLEEFLVKNNMIQSEKSEKETPETGKPSKQECPFCLILQNKIPSYKLEENKKSLAILEINPLSPGHTLVISKNHTSLPASAFSLASKIGKRLKSKLSAEEIKIENSQVLGHHLINVIPIYKNKKLEKKKAEEKELILLQDKLKRKPRDKKEKQVKENLKQELEKAPVRKP